MPGAPSQGAAFSHGREKASVPLVGGALSPRILDSVFLV